MLVSLLQMVVSDEIQGLVGVMVQAAETVTGMMKKILPAVIQLQNYLRSIKDLNLGSNKDLLQVSLL